MPSVHFRVALEGIFLLLFTVLTAALAHSPSQQDVSSTYLADTSNVWSFAPRDHLFGEASNERRVDGDSGPSSIQPILDTAWDGTSAYQQIGTSGVAVMQMSVIDDQYVIFFDKAEHNPLDTSDGNHAWSALFDTHAHTVRALKLITDSFCAGELYLPLHHTPQFNHFIRSANHS
jgi:hypothetical protein